MLLGLKVTNLYQMPLEQYLLIIVCHEARQVIVQCSLIWVLSVTSGMQSTVVHKGMQLQQHVE